STYRRGNSAQRFGTTADDFELAPLIVLAQEIANDVGGEAALRANGELVERDELRRLVDAPLERIDALELRYFRADEPEHHHLALGYKPQRRKTARARTVVFEQETIVRQFIEQPFGNCVVAALAVPHAALVAATEMDAARHLGET